MIDLTKATATSDDDIAALRNELEQAKDRIVTLDASHKDISTKFHEKCNMIVKHRAIIHEHFQSILDETDDPDSGSITVDIDELNSMFDRVMIDRINVENDWTVEGSITCYFSFTVSARNEYEATQKAEEASFTLEVNEYFADFHHNEYLDEISFDSVTKD